MKINYMSTIHFNINFWMVSIFTLITWWFM